MKHMESIPVDCYWQSYTNWSQSSVAKGIESTRKLLATMMYASLKIYLILFSMHWHKLITGKQNDCGSYKYQWNVCNNILSTEWDLKLDQHGIYSWNKNREQRRRGRRRKGNVWRARTTKQKLKEREGNWHFILLGLAGVRLST